MGSLLDAVYSGIAALLAFCYSIVGDYALAIAMFTLIIMLVFTPLTLKSTRSMMAMQRLQPEMKRLQTKYKDDRQTLNEEMMALYQREGVNPLGGCLPLLIQMPIFLVLFQVLRGLTRTGDDGVNFDPKYLDEGTDLYTSLTNAGGEMVSFGVDLARQANDVVRDDLVTSIPYLILVGITAVTSWYQQRQMAARRANSGPLSPQAQQQQAILKFLPWMLPVFAFFMPAGLVVYFIVSNLYRVGQQAYIHRTMPAPGELVIDDDDDDDEEPARPSSRRTPRERPERSASSGDRPRPRPRSRSGQSNDRSDRATPRPASRRASGGRPAPTSRTGGPTGANRPANKKKRKKR